MRSLTRHTAIITVVVLFITATASAGQTWTPSDFKLVAGKNMQGDPGKTLFSDDGSYLTVDSQRVDRARKVIYKVTFTELPTNEDTVQMRFIGGVDPNETCFMRLALYKWRSKRFVVIDEFEIPDMIDDLQRIQEVSNALAFISKSGSLRAKYSCTDEEAFTLETDRLTVE